jgi:transposase InsO family protein
MAAKMAVIEFTKSSYNRRRPHLSIGYRIFAEAMEAFFKRRKPMAKAITVAA